jgi:hypothetical protein
MLRLSGFKTGACARAAALVGMVLSCWVLPAPAAAQGEPPAVQSQRSPEAGVIETGLQTHGSGFAALAFLDGWPRTRNILLRDFAGLSRAGCWFECLRRSTT